MADQEPALAQRMGRPSRAPTAEARLPVDVIEAADAYAAENAFSRSEAIRKLVEMGARGRSGLNL
jgi:hypothetical protein